MPRNLYEATDLHYTPNFSEHLPTDWRNDILAALPADDGARAVRNLELAFRGFIPADWAARFRSRPPATRHERAVWNLLRVLCGHIPELWCPIQYPTADPANEQLTVALEGLVMALVTSGPDDFLFDSSGALEDEDRSFSSDYFSSSEDGDDDSIYGGYRSYGTNSAGGDQPDQTPTRMQIENHRGQMILIPDDNSSPREIGRFWRRMGLCVRHSGEPQRRSECSCNNMTRRARLARWTRERIPGTADRTTLREREMIYFGDIDNHNDAESTRTHVSNPPPPYEAGSWVDIALPPCYTSTEDMRSRAAGPSTTTAAGDGQTAANFPGITTDGESQQQLTRAAILPRMVRCIGRLLRDDFRHQMANPDDFQEMSQLVRQLCRRQNAQQSLATDNALSTSEPPQARPPVARMSSMRRALRRVSIGRRPGTGGSVVQGSTVADNDVPNTTQLQNVPRGDVDASSRSLFALTTVALARIQTSWRDNGQGPSSQTPGST